MGNYLTKGQRKLRADILRVFGISYPEELFIVYSEMPIYKLVIKASDILDGYIHYALIPFQEKAVPYQVDLPADSLLKIKLESDDLLYEQLVKLASIYRAPD